jgi:hypothetical protein
MAHVHDKQRKKMGNKTWPMYMIYSTVSNQQNVLTCGELVFHCVPMVEFDIIYVNTLHEFQTRVNSLLTDLKVW